MRSIEDMTVLVTGATDGLGRSVAADLAHRGATVLVHGRDPRRGERALADIRSHTEDARLELHLADFAHLAQVAELADEVERLRPDLNVLINNAGIGAGLPEGRDRQESRDGYELRFAVNYLAGFLLTQRLLPLLRRNAPARIVNVASLPAPTCRPRSCWRSSAAPSTPSRPARRRPSAWRSGRTSRE